MYKPQSLSQPPHPPRLLEVTVVSAEALLISNRLIKKNAFVTVRTDPQNYASTTVDSEGGSYPSWNEKLQLNLPAHSQTITVEVQCKFSSVQKMVGTAKIPLSDIVSGYVPAHHLHFLSYRLRQPDGERNGIINLCVKMVGTENIGGRPFRPLLKNNVSGPLPPLGKMNLGGPLPASLGKNSSCTAVGVPVGTYQYGV